MKQVAVIGGGPAGLAATVFALRKGLDVVLVAGELGGKTMMTMELPNQDVPPGLRAQDQVDAFRHTVEYLGVWRRGHVSGIREEADGFSISMSGTSKTPGDAEAILAERLVVATGTRENTLNVPGAARFFGKNLGSSSISYTHLLRGKTVVIIGDSDRAIESAMEASVQASSVHLLLEPHAEYSRTHLHMAESRGNVLIMNGYHVVGFDGDDFARTVEIVRGDIGTDRHPHTNIEADAFFVEREPAPNSDIVGPLVHRTNRGSIQIEADNSTSNPRIFAAGDVTIVGIEQILVALGEGARAGLAAYQSLAIRSV